jgi:hypothetical protein
VPVVVGLVAALDALLGHVPLPELQRLVVVEVDGGPEPLLGQAVAAVVEAAVSSSQAKSIAPCLK